MTADSYGDFLARKAQHDVGDGLHDVDLPDFLFPFQDALVGWALSRARAAIFADCGLGKTPMQLAWADQVRRATGKPVLVITPLAVAFQTAGEAEKFGIDASVSRDGSLTSWITITNYEQLHHFDPALVGGVVCDESSAIKAFDGQRRAVVTEFLRTLPYRLLCTATAAPNDYIELGTSSEALGYLGHMDMLGRFFTNREGTSSMKIRQQAGVVDRSAGWRFKGHAEDAFWRWVASWARAMRRPSDLGFADDGFDLPALRVTEQVVTARTQREGTLFDLPAMNMRDEREEARRTIEERCEMAAELLGGDEPGVAWCNLNAEGDLLTKMIPGAVQVKGNDDPDAKEEALHAFSRGDVRVLVTKPIIGAWGLNWQHCNRMTFFPTHSYEQYYQAVRRCWRFGQTRPVNVNLITTEGGLRAKENLQRKATQADRMFDRLVMHMRDALEIRRASDHVAPIETPAWMTSTDRTDHEEYV